MKINLLRHPSLKHRRSEMIRRLNLTVLIISSGLFIVSVLFISSRYLFLQIKANDLKQKIGDLEKGYFGRSSEIVDYIRVSQVISQMSEIQAKRFKYKEFLRGVFSFLPEGANLSSIDFGNEGILLVSIKFGSIDSYEQFVARLRDQSSLPGFLFKAVAQKSLIRASVGVYQASLEIKI